MSVETDIADAIVLHALELQKLSAHDEARADAELRALADDLRAILNRDDLTRANKREIAAIIKAAEEAIAGRYINAAGIVDVTGIVQHVAERTVAVMDATMPGLPFGPPSVETIRSLAKNILIDGAPSAAWWARQSEDAAFRFGNIVRRGVLNGETNEQIARKVVGDTGLLGTSRRNARALVHSSIMTAANRARLETFRKNARYADGVRFLATLDSHVCMRCAALDGKGWDFDGDPIGHDQPLQMAPLHFSCRCVMSIIPGRKALDEVFPGMADKFAALQDRATAGGPQKVTMNDWLHRNPAAAEEVLGKKRVALFQSGKLTLTDLVTKSGQPKTLAQLNAR
ncbi:MAG TPA: phage minor head protein [Novosphingobium sp.]|nr:phage minor head protein [Novosphingobium sp.]